MLLWSADLYRRFGGLFEFLCLTSGELNFGQALHCVLENEHLTLLLQHLAFLSVFRDLTVNVNRSTVL